MTITALRVEDLPRLLLVKPHPGVKESVAAPLRRDGSVIAAFTALCVIWSSTWLVIKIGLQDLPPISFAALRFVIAIAVLLTISTGRVRLLPTRRADFWLLAYTGILMFSVNYGLLFWGELNVSSGLAAVFQATIPIFGLVFGHYLLPAEPLRWQKLVGSLVALAGVAAICVRLLDFNGVLAFWGGLGIVIGSASAAFSNTMMKARAIPLAPAMIAAWQMIFGTVPMLVAGWIVEGNPIHFHWNFRAILCLLYLSVVGSALAFVLLYWLLPRMKLASLQTISLVTPPGAIVLGWLAGGEKLTLSLLFGTALVLAGVWMIFRKIDPPAERARPSIYIAKT